MVTKMEYTHCPWDFIEFYVLFCLKKLKLERYVCQVRCLDICQHLYGVEPKQHDSEVLLVVLCQVRMSGRTFYQLAVIS